VGEIHHGCLGEDLDRHLSALCCCHEVERGVHDGKAAAAAYLRAEKEPAPDHDVAAS
jgi:hypothetical protein